MLPDKNEFVKKYRMEHVAKRNSVLHHDPQSDEFQNLVLEVIADANTAYDVEVARLQPAAGFAARRASRTSGSSISLANRPTLPPTRTLKQILVEGEAYHQKLSQNTEWQEQWGAEAYVSRH